jgi:hypothetical protein
MRYTTLGVLALGLVVAACGSNTEQRSASGAGSGVVAGALVGGPVGALVGAAAGGAGGAALDEGVDKKAENAVEKAKRDDTASGASGSSTARRDATASAGSGSSTAAAGRMNATQIRANLKRDGYVKVGKLHRSGDTYKAAATKDGQRYDLTIDAKSGDVRDSRAI